MPEPNPLPPELESVVEQLAQRVHEAWASHRQDRGWRYGSERDDHSRLSPALVPYDQLTQAERDLDRLTVRRTIQGLEELGYRLELDVSRDRTGPARDQLLGQVDALIAGGRPLPAYDLSKRWVRDHPADAEMKLRNARALRRCGALQHALGVLDELGHDPDPDGERRGLRAAVHKEMFCRYRTEGEMLVHLRTAQRLYQDVFEESNGKQYWHGINAATLAFVLGRVDLARDLAQRVVARCGELEAASDGDYWVRATRAEAALVLGRFDAAAAEYRQALVAAGDRIGDIGSTRQNAKLLLDAYGLEATERSAIDAALKPPAVILFAGYTLDGDSVLRPRFPANIEADVRAALKERLQSLGAGFGFSGAAPGAEMLFVEALLERRPGVANVVLPWPRDQFIETHVRRAGESWLQRFAALLGDGVQQGRVQRVVNATLGTGIEMRTYEQFSRQLLFGLARLHARTLATDVVPLVVWDGANAHGQPDDVGEVLEQWRAQGLELGSENVIDVAPLLRPGRAQSSSSMHLEARASDDRLAFRVMAILFADVEDYSRIPESRLPTFIEYFVGGIAGHLGLVPYKPVNVRRVGDGLLMVFSNVRDAGRLAIDLVEWASRHSQPGADGETFWSRLGLPRELRIRVALHSGPVFECVDPLTHAPSFEGAHINYAARIEPVTPGNQVYASEAFAALASSWPVSSEEFICEYVGVTSLAKKAGEYPLYHVRRHG